MPIWRSISIFPLYKKGTFADQIKLAEDALFVRLHGQRNQVGRWMMTVEDYKNLISDPNSFKEIFTLPSLPNQASLVKIPKGTTIWKGQVAGNKWGSGGGIQIQVDNFSNIEDVEDWFHFLNNF